MAAYTATISQTLKTTVTSVGKATVIYDPELSGTSKTVADKIAGDLQSQHQTATLAGTKSPAAAGTSDYKVIVVGGPIYADANLFTKRLLKQSKA